jgi:urea-proton symporter
MGWLYLWMGGGGVVVVVVVMISAAVVPVALTLLWSRQNWLAASLSPAIGLICALVAA